MDSQHEPDAAEIAEDILAYLRAHPQAADTLPGVVQWWLIRSRYLRGLTQVEAALALLIERGQVVASTGADGSRRYGAADDLPRGE